MTIRGACDSCGKAYRLPVAEREYTCKACGGTVHAVEEEEPVARAAVRPEDAEDRHGHAEHGSVLQHREAIDARRRKAARKRQLVWGVFLVLFLGGFVVTRLLRPEPARAALGGVASDLETGGAELVRAWNAGDVEALVQAFHPSARSTIRARLQRVAENRGWTAGFSAARADGSSLSEGTVAEPVKAVVRLAYVAEPLRAQFLLQFEPAHERWYAYHVDIPPPPLAPMLARFRAAWSRSSPQELVPFFPPDNAQKLADLVERKTRDLGWSQGYPPLGDGLTTGEDELRRATERIPGLKVETVVPVADQELKLRWQYRSEPDAWVLAMLTFPEKP